MPLVAAFLRAINVHGRRVGNADLVAAAEAGGFAGVTAYQAAGNLVLAVDEPLDEAATRLETALREGLDFLSEVFLRTGEELATVLGATPFPEELIASSAGAPHVGFLGSAPSADAAAAVEALGGEVDRLRVVGAELHWLPTQGVGRSRVSTDAIARHVGPLTVRTMGTVGRMHARFFAG